MSRPRHNKKSPTRNVTILTATDGAQYEAGSGDATDSTMRVVRPPRDTTIVLESPTALLSCVASTRSDGAIRSSMRTSPGRNSVPGRAFATDAIVSAQLPAGANVGPGPTSRGNDASWIPSIHAATMVTTAATIMRRFTP